MLNNVHLKYVESSAAFKGNTPNNTLLAVHVNPKNLLLGI